MLKALTCLIFSPEHKDKEKGLGEIDMNPSAGAIPKLNFFLYLEFAQHLVIFFLPAMIGVICSIAIKEFRAKNDEKKMNFTKKVYRIVIWSTPAAFIVCMVDIFVGPKVTDTVRVLIFGATFFLGMVGEDIANILANLRVWIKITKEIIKDLGDAIGKADIAQKVTDILEDETKDEEVKNEKKEEPKEDSSQKSKYVQ